jgi:hypothetical protein
MISLLECQNVRANLLPAFNTLRLSGNVLINTSDFFNGFQAGLEDEKYNLLLTAGWYTRPVRRSVLVKLDDRWFDQVWEQRHLFYGGLQKVFPLKYSLGINGRRILCGHKCWAIPGEVTGVLTITLNPGGILFRLRDILRQAAGGFIMPVMNICSLTFRKKSPHRVGTGCRNTL